MLIPLGILASAGGVPPAEPAYELISTTTLGSTASDVTFDVSSLASTYKHLQIRASIRAGKAAGDVPLLVRFNGVSSLTYMYHIIYGIGTTIANYSASSFDNGIYLGNPIPGTTATASAFAGVVIDILDPYSTTKNKTIRALYGSTSPVAVQFASGGFFSTASTTSITIYPDTGGWVAGSRFSIYGLKG